MRPQMALALLVLASAILAGCTGPPAPLPAATSTTAPAAAAMHADLGDATYRYLPGLTPSQEAWQQAFEEARFLELASEGINEAVALPRDLMMRMESCGEPNAFYDPQAVAISLCYELLDELMATFSADGNPEAAEMAMGAFVFVFFHELGHALQDQLDLPVTGAEEDAVDQFATLLLLDDEEAIGMAMHAAAYWFLRSGDTPAWDEHSPDQRRAYAILCLAYGYDPERLSGLVIDGYLPPSAPNGAPASTARRATPGRACWPDGSSPAATTAATR